MSALSSSITLHMGNVFHYDMQTHLIRVHTYICSYCLPTTERSTNTPIVLFRFECKIIFNFISELTAKYGKYTMFWEYAVSF